MPLLNGLDLIQEIRNRSLNVPIVILSGYNDFSYAKKALKLGVFDYLLKPIDPEELSNTLGKLKQLYANTVKEQQQHFFISLLSAEPPLCLKCPCRRLRKWLLSSCPPAAILHIHSFFRCPHYPSGKPYSWTKCWSRHFLLICFSKVNPVFWKMNISFSFFPLLIPTISMNWIITSPDSSGRLIFLNYPIHLCYGICENSHDRIYETLLSFKGPTNATHSSAYAYPIECSISASGNQHSKIYRSHQQFDYFKQ